MELNILVKGQSNAEILALNYSGDVKLKRAVEALLGFDGVHDKINILARGSSDVTDPATIRGGTRLIGDWLTPDSGGWEKGWNVGWMEQNLLNYVGKLSAGVRDNPTAVLWVHNEGDSFVPGLTTAQWESAARADAKILRDALGASAEDVPYYFVSTIPFRADGADGLNAIRQAMERLAADKSFNAAIGARAADLDMSRDNSDNNAATTEYGGWHMSGTDAALLIARSALSIASGWAEYAKTGSPLALAKGQIDDLGPQVVAAYVADAHTIRIDVKHDVATAFRALDVDAAMGVGWTLKLANGTVLQADTVKIVDGDTLSLHFAGTVAKGATLFYADGYGRLVGADGSGQGNAVYDNLGMPIWTSASGVTVGNAPPVTTVPVETTPVVTAPVITTPVETAPAETTPVVTKPVVTTPVVSTPAETAPAVTTPITTKPVTTTPVTTTPATGETDSGVAPHGVHLVADDASHAAQVVRLYSTILGRAPDQLGLDSYTAFLDAGGTVRDIAGSMLRSTEFAGRYGASADDADGVNHFLAKWTTTHAANSASELLKSSASPADFLARLSDSATGHAAAAPVFAAGVWTVDDTAQAIARLYNAAVQRLPDAGGIEFWMTEMKNGLADLHSLSEFWTHSPEFQATYGNLSNSAFVSQLYVNALDRHSEQGGQDWWTHALDNGQFTRGSMLLYFSESPEHQELVNQHILSTNPGHYGINVL